MTHKDYIDRYETISLKEWIVSYLLLCISIAGIIFLSLFFHNFSFFLKLS